MNEFQRALKRWADAKIIAADNSQLLRERNGKGAEECTRISDICKQRMDDLHDAEEMLMKFKDSPDASAAMRAYVAAETDKGCSRCWLSSRMGKNHPECNMKITRWFAARKVLFNEGLQLQ